MSQPITIDPPPLADEPAPQPLTRFLMPVIMLAAVGGMVILMVLKGNNLNPYMLMMPLFMGLSVLGMLAPTSTSDPDRTRRLYLRHIAEVKEEAEAAARTQRRDADRHHPDPATLWSEVGGEQMWVRGPNDPHFLHVRVGVGAVAPTTAVNMGEVVAVEDCDPLCVSACRHLIQTVSAVEHMPVTVSAGELTWLGVTGPRAADLARAMVAQLVFAHGPEVLHVRIAGQRNGLDALKWLPHVQSMESTPADAEVIVCVHLADVTAATVLEVAADCVTEQRRCVIIDVDTDPRTPVGARCVAEGLVLEADDTDELFIATVDGRERIGAPDLFTAQELENLARSLARFAPQDRQVSTSRRLSGDLPDLLGVDIHALNWDLLWKPGADPRRFLAVPIGVSGDTPASYRPVVLDFKESALGGDGPHGLCIGATGSGKSELIRTIVVALALTHSPDDLNFIFVDFKGGATFLELGKLPHTAAVITNLAEESLLVERMAEAITGEITRRQEVLRAAGCDNITAYRSLRANNPTVPPLPELLLVIDEFSELLGQHPEFAELFVTVGRVGRSLGLHLLLASQRLDEGRLRGLDSHLSYRIGLKTFSAGESRQVIGVPDAYQLPNRPGVGYLRTGADQLVRFQAAYVSGPIPGDDAQPASGPQSPEDAVPAVRPFTLAELDRTDDATTKPPAPQQPDVQTALPAHSLVDHVVAGAVAAAAARGMSAHQVWLPPLPREVPIGSIVGGALKTAERPLSASRLAAPIGLVDRPAQQRQDPYWLDLAGAGGHVGICGGPQTGKTTALRTICLSFAALHPTQRLQVYVLDLAGTELADVAGLPHVVGVAHRDDPERVERVFTQVRQLVDAPAADDFLHTLLLIDGYHVLAEEFEAHLSTLNHIAADGLASRVHLVVTTPRWSAIRPAVRDLLATRLELHLTEPLDSVIDRHRQEHVPALPGRGLTGEGEALAVAVSGPEDTAYVAHLCSDQPPVERLRMLPTQLQRATISTNSAPGNILIGVGGATVSPVWWDSGASPHCVIVGGAGSGKTTLLRTIGRGVEEFGDTHARVVIIDPRRSLLGSFARPTCVGYAATTDTAAQVLSQLAVTLRERIPGPDVSVQELKERSWWDGPDIFLLIDDLSILPESLFGDLVPLLPYARDIGLHVVVARSSAGAGRSLFAPFVSAVMAGNSATCLLSADPHDGPLFGLVCATSVPGRAQFVQGGGRAQSVHVVMDTNDSDSDSEDNSDSDI